MGHWDQTKHADAYQICRNCQIDADGKETDPTVGSLYTLDNYDLRDAAPHFFATKNLNTTVATGKFFHRASRPLTSVCERELRQIPGLGGLLRRGTHLIQQRLENKLSSEMSCRECNKKEF